MEKSTVITKEQWEIVEKELAQSWVNVTFEYKGFELSIQRQRLSESKTVLGVFINGEIKGAWTNVFDDESSLSAPVIIKDVWKLKSKAKYKADSIKEIEKFYGKRRAKKEYPELHERYEFWLPYFPKASVLVRQFKKLEGIKLIKAACLEDK